MKAEGALSHSLEDTARSQRMLLALSQAAQAVQRTRTPDEVYRTVGDEVAPLGYSASIFILTDDRAHLTMPHLSFERNLVRTAEKLVGVSAQDYRIPLVPNGFFQQVIAEGETALKERFSEVIAEALPRVVRPLAGRVASMLGIEQGIVAPVMVGGETEGLLVVTGKGLTEIDVPAISLLANQTAIALESARLYQETQHRADALQQSEERFESLLRSINDVVWSASGDGSEFLYINDAAERVYGRPTSEFFENPNIWADAVHPDDKERVWRESQDLFERGTTASEYRIIRPDGEVRWLHDRKHVSCDDSGAPIRLGGIASDVTERKKADAELRALAETLEQRVAERTRELEISRAAALNMMADAEEARTIAEQANEELRLTLVDLERSNEELANFAYVASHDLQEPLRMISSYTQLLARRYQGRLDADADEFIAYAVEGAERLQSLLNDLLAYSRVNTRGKPFETTDCHSSLGRALASLRTTIEESAALITCDELPTVLADPAQLVQLFQNLLGNAVKFRSEKAPRVHLSATLQSQSEEGPNEWVFSVRDNGIGIESQYFDRIFVIFKRLHTRAAYPGTGTGLAISKRIVERHGGRIWVESEPDVGSTFYFTLPAISYQLSVISD